MATQPSSTSVPSVPLRQGLGQHWTVLGAVATVTFVIGASMLAALLMQSGYEIWRRSLDTAAAVDFPGANDPVILMAVQLASQLLQLLLLWSITAMGHRNPAAALGLTPSRLTINQWVGAVALLFGVKILATLAVSGIVPSDPGTELRPFLELVRSPNAWFLFLAAVVLAGLTEELLFRGVLSRTLEATRLGFWGGAALASAAFALLHMQYGVGGQIVIFAVGMTLAWIRAWSGSLWPAVVCHSLNNAVALLAMRAMG